MASLQEKIAQLGGLLGNTLTSMSNFLVDIGLGGNLAAGGQPGENLSLRNPFLNIDPQIILNFGDKTEADLKVDIENALGLTEGSLEQQDLGELFGALQQQYPDTFAQVISALTGASSIDVGVAIYEWSLQQAAEHLGLDSVPIFGSEDYNRVQQESAAILSGEVTEAGQAWIDSQNITEGPTQKEITSQGRAITDKQGNTFIMYDGVKYIQDASKQWVPAETTTTDVRTGGETVLEADTTVTEGPEFIQRQEDITKDAMRQALDDAGYTYDDAYIDKVYEDYGMNNRSVEEAQALTVQDWGLNNYTKEEAAAIFNSLGYEYTDAELEQFVINNSSDARLGDQNVRDYVNANTVDAKEYSRIFYQVNGRAPTAEELEAFFGEGNNRIKYEESTLQANLETEAKENLWETQILPAIEAGGDFVKTAIFGPSSGGGPKTVDEMFEEWMQSEMDQLKGPLTVTVDPNQGLLLEIMIPVNFEVNGSPLKIEIFDEDGNFVGVQEIGSAVWNAAEGAWGQIVDGVFTPIQEIFTGTEGNVVERIFDAAESVLATGGLSAAGEGGWLGGVLGELVTENLGFYNPETNTVEGIETVDTGDLLNGDADLNGSLTEEKDEDTGLPVIEQQEEPETTPTTKAPRGRVISDKQGNIVGISGDDGNFYIQDAEGNWVVRPEGTDVGGETVLPADTIVTDTDEDIIDTSDAPDVTSVDNQLGDDVIRPGIGEALTPETTDLPISMTDTDAGTGDGTDAGTGDGTDAGTGDGTDAGTGDGTDAGTGDESGTDYRDGTGGGPDEPEEPSITEILFGTPDGLQLLGMLGGQRGVTPIKPEPFTPVDLPFQWQPEKPLGLFDYKDLNEALRKLTR
jgi:hypothetical protein